MRAKAITTNYSVVPAVVTSVIYTAPPAATVTATIGVQEIALEEVESTVFMTQTSPGIVTHSFASTCIPLIELI